MAEFVCKENARTTIQNKVEEDVKEINVLFLNNDADVSCSLSTNISCKNG